jgi:hypothetical protein
VAAGTGEAVGIRAEPAVVLLAASAAASIRARVPPRQMWQMARASASAASAGSGGASSPSRRVTMLVTWVLPAATEPVTTALTSLGHQIAQRAVEAQQAQRDVVVGAAVDCVVADQLAFAAGHALDDTGSTPSTRTVRVFDTLIRSALAAGTHTLRRWRREVVMYVVPPMDDEPPPEYLAFVAGHLDSLRRETNRLVGGDFEAAHLYLDVLTDVAGHWRRLSWWGRLTRKDAATPYLERRLTQRTKQWREDQIYDVDIRVLRTPALFPAMAGTDRSSLALRKATVLPSTARSSAAFRADAGIAWVKAYRKQEWHRLGRLAVLAVLLVGGMIQYMSWLSSSY